MARGRFVSTSIAEDERLCKLSITAELLYLKTIPHLDRDGMISGRAGFLWGRVCPLREELIAETQRAINEWVTVGLVTRMDTDAGPVLFFPGFLKNNNLLHYDRETPSKFPVPPGYERTEMGLILEGAEQKKKPTRKPKEEQVPPSSSGNVEHVNDLVIDTIHDPVIDFAPKGEVKVKDQDQEKKKERAAATPPAPAQNPAVVVFRDVWKRNPSKAQMPTITTRVDDLELWRRACQAWADRGNKPTNVEGMLDWYDHPERFQTAYKPPPRGADPRSANNGVNAIMDYIQDRGLFK